MYTLIGLDADSFAPNGGDEFFVIAKQIVNNAASSNFSGWKATDGSQSRYRYNDAIVSNVYQEYRDALYTYHRLGLDRMESNTREGKLKIIDAIAQLKSVNDRRPNSYLLRTFFDAKSDEITSIFSGGPQVDINTLVTNLNRIAPTRRSNWSNIRL